MRIFTKKAFEFKNADGGRVVTRPLDFADVPDWVTQDPIFEWGVDDGDITVTETRKEEAAAEKAAAENKIETADVKTDAEDKNPIEITETTKEGAVDSSTEETAKEEAEKKATGKTAAGK